MGLRDKPLSPEFYIYVLVHPVCKMRIIHGHFEEKKNGDFSAFLKHSVRIFIE